jgi:flagellar biosynthesis/type III secretory pathway chaperone
VSLASEKSSASRLAALLDEEFEALKAQDLDRFEALQPEKASLIGRLAAVQPPETRPDDISFGSDWRSFQDTVLECRDRHRRNSILIQRKLDAIRAALKTLQGADPTSSVEVYDRLGRIAVGRKKSSYTDA